MQPVGKMIDSERASPASYTYYFVQHSRGKDDIFTVKTVLRNEKRLFFFHFFCYFFTLLIYFPSLVEEYNISQQLQEKIGKSLVLFIFFRHKMLSFPREWWTTFLYFGIFYFFICNFLFQSCYLIFHTRKK